MTLARLRGPETSSKTTEWELGNYGKLIIQYLHIRVTCIKKIIDTKQSLNIRTSKFNIHMHCTHFLNYSNFFLIQLNFTIKNSIYSYTLSSLKKTVNIQIIRHKKLTNGS